MPDERRSAERESGSGFIFDVCLLDRVLLHLCEPGCVRARNVVFKLLSGWPPVAHSDALIFLASLPRPSQSPE